MERYRPPINSWRRAQAMHATHVDRPLMTALSGIGGGMFETAEFFAVDDRPTLAAPDDDPYLWLEDVEGERALDFVETQNRRTLEKFGKARFAVDRDTLAAIYDRPDNIPYVTRNGGLLYNLWKDAKNPRGLWRRTTLESFRTQNPDWEVLLDIDGLAADEDADWLLNWTTTRPGRQSQAVVSLSRGGSDAVTLREFDM